MRATWSAFYTTLLGTLCRLSAEHHFRTMQEDFPAFGNSATISGLLAHQRAAGADPTSRYRVIHLLVAAARSGKAHSPTAHTMVIVALWPGLDAAYHRLWRKFPSGRADLPTDLLSEISVGIARLDLTKVRSVAATLIRNAERDVGRALIAQEKLSRVTRDITESAVENEATGLMQAEPDKIADLNARLANLPEQDAVLMKRIFILGETQAQAGQALGLSPAAARKRFQRALAKLDPPKNFSAALSHSVPAIGL